MSESTHFTTLAELGQLTQEDLDKAIFTQPIEQFSDQPIYLLHTMVQQEVMKTAFDLVVARITEGERDDVKELIEYLLYHVGESARIIISSAVDAHRDSAAKLLPQRTYFNSEINRGHDRSKENEKILGEIADQIKANRTELMAALRESFLRGGDVPDDVRDAKSAEEVIKSVVDPIEAIVESLQAIFDEKEVRYHNGLISDDDDIRSAYGRLAQILDHAKRELSGLSTNTGVVEARMSELLERITQQYYVPTMADLSVMKVVVSRTKRELGEMSLRREAYFDEKTKGFLSSTA